jgi:hypothetical protein
MAHFLTRLKHRDRLLIETECGSALLRVERFGGGTVQLSLEVTPGVRFTPEKILAYGAPAGPPPTDARANADWRAGRPADIGVDRGPERGADS